MNIISAYLMIMNNHLIYKPHAHTIYSVVPTIMGYGALYNSGTINYGDFTYFLISSWTSSGVTLSLFLTSGSVVLFASDITQSPSTLGGYVWRLQSSSYSELFLNPSTLGRQAGDYVAIALQGNSRPTSSFVIQVDSGNTVTTGWYKINYPILKMSIFVLTYMYST